MKNISFPTTAGEFIEHLITECAFDAGKVQREVTAELGSAFVGTKVTQTASRKIIGNLLNS